MYNIICVIFAVFALATMIFAGILITILLARVAWEFSKYLLNLTSCLLKRDVDLAAKRGYDIEIAYFENNPVWAAITLYCLPKEWSLLKNSEGFKQITLYDLCEPDDDDSKINFCVSFDHWRVIEQSLLFNSIVNGTIRYESKSLRSNND